MNGRLDDAGPLEDGRRLGLRIITLENRAGYLEGQQAGELLTHARESTEAFSFVSHRLVLMKEAVLDFACRHDLPPPSWWTEATNETPLVHQTGAPGRPTSMHLVEAEYRARSDRGEAKTSIGAEAEWLAEWLQKKHPDAPQLTPKTIANRLRREHRERIAKSRN
jgi:hypothetical protein